MFDPCAKVNYVGIWRSNTKGTRDRWNVWRSYFERQNQVTDDGKATQRRIGIEKYILEKQRKLLRKTVKNKGNIDELCNTQFLI